MVGKTALTADIQSSKRNAGAADYNDTSDLKPDHGGWNRGLDDVLGEGLRNSPGLRICIRGAKLQSPSSTRPDGYHVGIANVNRGRTNGMGEV